MFDVEITSDDLHLISLFSSITHVSPSRFFDTPGGYVFLVNPFDMRRAIGKQGSNVARLRKALKKQVFIYPEVNSPEAFVRQVLSNVHVLSTEVREAPGEKVLFLTIDERDRGIAIGKGGFRIKMLKQVLSSLYGLDLKLRTKRVIDMG